MTLTLQAHPSIPKNGPLLVLVLDGVGLGPGDAYDAVAQAKTPVLDTLLKDDSRFLPLKAHGRAVGLPSDDDMGNSEVGHNALGSGRIVMQGAALVDAALLSGAFFESDGWRDLERACTRGGTLHLFGLLSDGGVHSRLDQVHKIVDGAVARGVKHIRLHVLTDGRDVPDGSSLRYVALVEAHFAELAKRGVDACIASGGGRMHVTMDRYESDWSVVERGWNAHVHGDARRFSSASEAIETFYREDAKASDQYLPAFVVEKDGAPVGAMRDGDAVLCVNFRGDRVIQISRAFDDETFTFFDRGRRPDVTYAGMMVYDGDLNLPRRSLVAPPAIARTSGEYLATMGVRVFAVSETHKYGHVTYFWNGNRSGKFDERLETYDEVRSDPRPFTEQPEMRARAIADDVVDALESNKYDVVRVNIANGDMIGHTGDLHATIRAVEVTDEVTGRMLDAVKRVGGCFIVTADHGNADDMVQRDKKGAPLVDEQGRAKPRTSHTLSPVPFVIGGPGLPAFVRVRKDLHEPGLANVAATMMNMLGYAAPDDYEPTLLEIVK
jgi:2,3-bisphosphoglycerate-independent phosphoglycerate mutase